MMDIKASAGMGVRPARAACRAVVAVVALFTGLAVAAPSESYRAIPPFVAQNEGAPNVIISFDNSGSMKEFAYRDAAPGSYNGDDLHGDFDPAVSYSGYFDPTAAYVFDAGKGFFIKADGLANPDQLWSGNFLNWLTMRRIDIARKVTVGGKVRLQGKAMAPGGYRTRVGEVVDGRRYFVLEGQLETTEGNQRQRWYKTYAGASSVSPFPDGQIFQLAEGRIIAMESASDSFSVSTRLSDAPGANLEVGQVSLSLDVGAGDVWFDVPLKGAYTDPVVVVTGITGNGGDPVVARVRNVTPSGFEVRLQEYPYSTSGDGHVTETVGYIVAEAGAHSATVRRADGSLGTVRFDAGRVGNVTWTLSNDAADSGVSVSEPLSGFAAAPAVFTSVEDVADPSTTVVSRALNVSAASFEVVVQEQEPNAGGFVGEDVAYVAISRGRGTVDTADGTDIPFEVGVTGASVDDAGHTISFQSAFEAPPLFIAHDQSTFGEDTSNVRYESLSASGVRVWSDEEEAFNTEVSHTGEEVAYMAVRGQGALWVRVGVPDNEPTGLIQQFDDSIRFGLALFTHDHGRGLDPYDSGSIYHGNTVHGGTLYPCFPDEALEVASQTNFDFCLPTHVKAPTEHLIQAIEEYPLTWGTTPIAETLYEILGYVAQEDRGRQAGEPQWYDNGTPGYPSYQIGNDWDPYYYDEFGGHLPCCSVFVVNINDGEPYRDFDGAGHPPGMNDGRGSFGDREALDDVALRLRTQDVRGDLAEHQEIISYFIFAALGEGSSNEENSRKMREAAANGGFVDDNLNRSPDPGHPLDFTAYVTGGGCAQNEWDRDPVDCNPDTFTRATDEAELRNALTGAFRDILDRAGTGSAASVISASAGGEGAVYQALFYPARANEATGAKITWAGEVHGLFIDDAGLLREDGDGDRTLDAPAVDRIVDSCFDSDDETVRVRRSVSEADRPSAAQAASCAESVYPDSMDDVKYLWSAAERLAGLSDAQVLTQRPYASMNGRHIIAGVDLDGDGLVRSGEQRDFLLGGTNGIPASLAGLLSKGGPVSASDIVDFVRGDDVPGLRSREFPINGAPRTWRLGDIIHSTPTYVGRPAESYDLLYSDASYGRFIRFARDRRGVVYAGANDGMLHAFNAGFFDPGQGEFRLTPMTGSAVSRPLGSELWAYVPYNALAHLEQLADPGYGTPRENHLYFVDGKPRVFDARVFGAGGITGQAVDRGVTGTDGWGTLLVVGMRFGGGEIAVDHDADASTPERVLRSSYSVLDITDPEQPPKLLLEFSHPNLGFTTSMPTPVKVGDDWYLVMGSGPAPALKAALDSGASAQAGRVFVINLKSMALETGFGSGGVWTLSQPESFIGDTIAADWDLNPNPSATNAVYFGVTEGSSAPFDGRMMRVVPPSPTAAVPSWKVNTLIDTNGPVTAAANVSVDTHGNQWVFFGTGRFLVRHDAIDTSVNRSYGVKEPEGPSGALSYAQVTDAPLDVSASKVASNGAVSGISGVSSFSALLSKMHSDTYPGWVRGHAAGERIVGQSTLLGGSLTFTSFEPTAAVCEIGGTSRLYGLDFRTGTANPVGILGVSGSSFTDGAGNTLQELSTVVEIGPRLSPTPSLHRGAGYRTDRESKVLVQSSAGEIRQIKQENPQSVRSGESSWRVFK